MAWAGSACAAGWLDPPKKEKPFRPFWFAEAGVNWQLCPQLGATWEYRRSWQIGLEMRSWVPEAKAAYDFLPEADLHVRKLWLGAEERESLRNSEYVDLAAGAFFGYRFLPYDDFLLGRSESRSGPRPQIRVTVGKYWMPFPSLAWGLDANLTLGHYFTAHPPGFRKSELVTASMAVFYPFP